MALNLIIIIIIIRNLLLLRYFSNLMHCITIRRLHRIFISNDTLAVSIIDSYKKVMLEIYSD